MYNISVVLAFGRLKLKKLFLLLFPIENHQQFYVRFAKCECIFGNYIEQQLACLYYDIRV